MPEAHALKEMRLTVEGMHCASCVALIREELEDQGAKDVKVGLTAAQRGEVALATSKSRAEVVKIIEGLGSYKVR
jgi:copper chaperone CopZ